MTQKMTLADRLRAKLRKMGLSERKAMVLVRGLMPMVRGVVKAEMKRQAEPVESAEPEYLPANEPFTLAKKPIKVNGHELRVDLPV